MNDYEVDVTFFVKADTPEQALGRVRSELIDNTALHFEMLDDSVTNVTDDEVGE